MSYPVKLAYRNESHTASQVRTFLFVAAHAARHDQGSQTTVIQDQASMKTEKVTCPLERTLKILSGRWKILIVRELIFNETARFGELHRALTGISQRMLIRELKMLQFHGIVIREALDEVPIRVQYRLTDKGLTLKPILAAMSNWATENDTL